MTFNNLYGANLNWNENTELRVIIAQYKGFNRIGERRTYESL